MAPGPGTAPAQRTREPSVGHTAHSSPLLDSPTRPSLISRGTYVRRSSSLDVRREDRSDSVVGLIAIDTLTSHETKAPATSSTFSTNDRALETLPERRRRLGLSAPPTDLPAQGTTRGHRWKRETSSHLIELRVTRRDHQKGSPPVGDFPQPTTTDEKRVDGKHGYEVTESAVSTLQRTGTITASSSTARRNTPLSKPRTEYSEGLYCRVRRRLGLKKGRFPGSDEEKSMGGIKSETGMMLSHAAELLRDVPDRRPTLNALSTRTSKLSIAAAHHQEGAQSSATSSLRNLFMGKVPLPTPDPAELYTGSDNGQYFRVEMSSSEAPNFLPSEARRIDTPPMPGGKDSGRKLRGFFFDFRPPGEDSEPTPLSREASSVNRKSFQSFGTKPEGSDSQKEREWFRVRVQTFSDQNTFELDVPDHLPNSPMCAKNPKHTSGGKGICPYHGRARTGSTQASDSTEKIDKTKNEK
ncbi:accessory factor associated with RNA polymerase II [Xylographa opegraphella]|nr:accessory factor associated with RNA polymerase II [Xylographa opegraphella]